MTMPPENRNNEITEENIHTKCLFCSGYEEKIQSNIETEWSNELAELKKHDIISEIASYFGHDPEFLQPAEDVFDQIKYRVAEYVLKYEYNCESNLSVEMALWLEEKQTPEAKGPLSDIIGHYLKKNA